MRPFLRAALTAFSLFFFHWSDSIYFYLITFYHFISVLSFCVSCYCVILSSDQSYSKTECSNIASFGNMKKIFVQHFALSVPKGCKDYGNAFSHTPFWHWASDFSISNSKMFVNSDAHKTYTVKNLSSQLITMSSYWNSWKAYFEDI